MICTKCGKDLPETEFPFRNKTKNIRRRECCSCNKEFQKQIYDRNKKVIDDWKMQGCAKCGDKRIYIIDAHHINPETKTNTVVKLKINSSIQRILEELSKCIPLCANCHREFHFLESLQNITIEEYLKE